MGRIDPAPFVEGLVVIDAALVHVDRDVAVGIHTTAVPCRRLIPPD
jgi:hypothetical protein